MTDQSEHCTCGHARRDHSTRHDHEQRIPGIDLPPWCHVCHAECIYCPPEALEEESAGDAEVTIDLREHLAAVFAEKIDGTEGCANRYRLADAALGAFNEYLDVGDAEAWCKVCRRVWDSKHHQCESDAELRLSKVRDLRADLREITGARWIVEALDTILDAPLEQA